MVLCEFIASRIWLIWAMFVAWFTVIVNAVSWAIFVTTELLSSCNCDSCLACYRRKTISPTVILKILDTRQYTLIAILHCRYVIDIAHYILHSYWSLVFVVYLNKIHVQTNTKSVQCLCINTKHNKVRKLRITQSQWTSRKHAYWRSLQGLSGKWQEAQLPQRNSASATHMEGG